MNACPRHEQLTDYEKGILSEVEAEPIERHLAECAACRAAMARIRSRDRRARALQRSLQRSGTSWASSTGSVFSAPGAVTAAPVRPDPQRPVVSSGSPEWIIPDYERVVLCGEGSYGSVWAVRDRVGVYRALKVIDLERIGRGAAAQRERSALETYCRKISRHPYLVAVHHVGLVGSILYYTMELADDRNTKGMVRDHFPPGYSPLTLETIIRGRRLHVDVAMELARRLLRGLSKLHSFDLVHRDVKPSNVIFVNRQPKLADVGMVTADTDGGRGLGTPRYMPPDRCTDKTADTYAFGKVLFEMIAGRDSPGFPALPDAYRRGSRRWDLSQVNDLIVHACSPRAADRYPSAAAMLEDLEACADLRFDSLFDELSAGEAAWSPTAARPAGSRWFGLFDDRRRWEPASSDRPPRNPYVEISLAFVRIIPWILGFAAVMFALSRW